MQHTAVVCSRCGCKVWEIRVVSGFNEKRCARCGGPYGDYRWLVAFFASGLLVALGGLWFALG